MKKIAVALVFLLSLIVCAAMADTLVLPEDLTVIEAEAFYGTDAETIILPPGVTFIGDAAFGGSASLRTVFVPDALLSRESAALTGSPNACFVPLDQDWSEQYSYSVKSDHVEISQYLGTDTNVSIPSIIEGKPVTIIGYAAFRENTALTSVSIPASVSGIGNSAFAYCTGLTSVSFSSGLVSIGDEAFRNCTALTSIRLPEHLTTIGANTFNGCSLLTDVTFPDSLTTMGNNAFTGCGNASEVPYSFVLPDHIEYMGKMAADTAMSFYGCDAIRIVTPGSDTALLLLPEMPQCAGLPLPGRRISAISISAANPTARLIPFT